MHHSELHERLIFEKIIEEAFNMQHHLLKALKQKVYAQNKLQEYIENRKGALPSNKEIIHNLINVELEDRFVLYDLKTSYSKVKIYGLQYQHISVLIIEFHLDGQEKPLRYGFVCHYNLIMAAEVNFSYKSSTSIADGNFILCEMLELLAIMDLLEASTAS